MPTLLDYMKWRGDIALSYDGFNELDAAVFCKLSYIPFEITGSVIQRQGISLVELAAYLSAVPEVEGKLMRSSDLEACRQVSRCRRYEPVKVYAYTSHWDMQSETQFAAMCFKLPSGLCCVAFRGTDDTLVGWKEDLNMGLMFPVPAQVSAAEYVNSLVEVIGDGALVLCGHSKGGNLAVYAGAYCDRDIQSRIQRIYNFDGPGFEREALTSPGYERISFRIHTYLPEFSVVGLLFENQRPHRVVKSEASGIMQHDLYHWEVSNGSFHYAEELTESSKVLARALDQWISEMDSQEREGFVDALYYILTQNNTRTVEELSVNKFENALSTLRTIRRLDEGTRANAVRALRLLLASFRNPAGGSSAP